MEDIDKNILDYLKNKNIDNPGSLPTMEQYLMLAHKEHKFISLKLIQRLRMLEEIGWIKMNGIHLTVTQKGLDKLKDDAV
jgi:hypothetical protein